MRLSVVLIAGFAALPLLAAPRSLAAQSGFHPRWEIPGLDFRKDGAWRVRARRVAELRHRLIAQRKMGALNAPALAGPAPSATQVTGTVLVPALFIGYANTDAQFMRDTSQYTSNLFGAAPPGGNPYTLRTFYEQMSSGVFSMRGQMIGWVVLDSNEVTYTGTAGTCTGNPYSTTNCNGIFSVAATKRMQDGFRQALARVDTGPTGINFAQFDNDGPDLIPNSGDDDGYVDMIMFAHPTKDGACGGFSGPNPLQANSTNNHIWSHRFVLVNSTSTNYQDYVTNDPAATNSNGLATIHISDYFTTTALGGASACDSTQIMPIGTAAHEFGHALGLPDLYDTQGPTEGIGEWGLMGSGNFTSPRSPSRMEAWSLNELGWVSLRILTAAGTYHLGAAPVSDTTFLVNVQGSNPRGEYFLLENRQAAQADTALIRIHCVRSGQPPNCPGGMLIWHADSLQLATNGFHLGNAVNVGAIHGLAVEEADGLGQLSCGFNGCNRGDAGDYYPGTSGSTKLSFNTNPAATKNWDGSFIGFAVDSIRQIVPGGEMAFRLRFGGLTVVEASDTNAVISVDAVNYNVFRNLFDSGSTHTVSVASPQTSVDGRTRWTWSMWSDGLGQTHNITGTLNGSSLTAVMDREFLLVFNASAGGTVSSNPLGISTGTFIPEGGSFQLTAQPAGAGASFVGWAGDTISSNPTITLQMGHPYTVTAVFVTTADVVAQLLGPTTPLTQAQIHALDAAGNNNGVFDVGDFLAWVKTTGAPLTADVMARLGQLSSKGGRP